MYFVTGNTDKIREARYVIPDVEQYELDTTEIQTLDEEAISRHKMREAREHLQEPFFVEDVSLRCEVLGGLPGPFVKFFLKKLSLDEIARIAAGPAQVRCTIGYWDGHEEHLIQSVIHGTIVPARGEDWGFNPIFEHESGQTFAQMAEHKRMQLNHRAQALKKLKEFITQ